MNEYARRACSFLEAVYDPGRALFPYTTRLEGDRYRSTFDHPAALRYSVNCLLALARAAELDPDGHPSLAHAGRLVDEFAERHVPDVVNEGDRGLFLVLASTAAGGTEHARRAAEWMRAHAATLAGESAAARLPLQEACWLLWGLIAQARAGAEDAAAPARALFRVLVGEFLDRDSLFPRHSPRGGRRGTVSFGGIVYFLRALEEYATWARDEYAETLFRHGVARVLAAQGADGAWPWFYDVRRGRPLDRYPVFGVHQDSMAMLFLLPALDRGLPGIHEAIGRSWAWVLGRNELGLPLLLEQPFFRYRSLERRGGLQRPRRYARSLAARAGAGSRLEGRARHVRVNRECRSYELGWVVYVWSGRLEELRLEAGEPAVSFPAEAARRPSLEASG